MKRFSEQLNKQAQSVKMQAAEKRELRERLVSYMEYHPLPAELKTKQVKSISNKKVAVSPIMTESFKTFNIPFHTLFRSSAIAAAIVLVVVPFVAERAVPGDTLYAVKVQFNEELRSTLTFDSYQKVEWETQRLNRRIAEARLLASEGRLTEEVEAEVAEAVKTHTENAQREIEVMRSQDADVATIASIELDTTLEVQSNSLRNDETESGIEEAATGQVTNLIANAIDKSLSESEAKNASSSIPAYDKLMARVEQNTTRVYELLESISLTAPSDKFADITRRLQDIERSIQAAIEISETDGDAARTQLVNVLQRTQKLVVLMTELEVAETVDIETLVPVVLTEDEEKTKVNSTAEELNAKIEEIEELSALSEDEEIKEKVDFANTELSKLMEIVTSSTTDFVVFEKAASEANAIVDDVLLLLRQSQIVLPEEPNEENITTSDEVAEEAETSEEQATSTDEVIKETTEESTEEDVSESVNPESEVSTQEETVDSI